MGKDYSETMSNILAKKDAEKKATIYSTERINKIKEDMSHGIISDMSPFYRGDPDLKDKGVLFKYTEKEIEELTKCASDCNYFVENYCKFLTDKGRILVTIRNYQHDMLHLMGDEKYDEELDEMVCKNKNIIICSSRQSGKTTTVVSYFCWVMCFHNDKQIAILANKGKTATEIIDKMQQVFKGLPFYMKPGIIGMGKTSMTLENGSYIMSATTNPTSITGQSVNLLYLDELAHLPEGLATDFWRSAYPTLSSFKNSQILITSTPKGNTNLFFRLYDGAMKGENGFIPYRVDWWQVPGRDEAWEKATRKTFGDENFDQEFGLQFEVESNKLVKAKDLKFLNRIKNQFINRDLSNFDKNLSDNTYWKSDFDPDSFTQQDYLKRYFVFMIDTSEGKEEEFKGKKDADWNIINIFEVKLLSPVRLLKNKISKSLSLKDAIRFEQVGIYMDNERDEEYMSEALKQLIFNVFKCGTGSIDNVRIMIEVNFNGKNVINKISQAYNFYDDIIVKTYHVQPLPNQKLKKKFGFKTVGGKKGKGYWCELGSKMISRRQIIVTQYDDNPNKSSLMQLQGFGKNEKGVYTGSCMHDDIAVTILFLSRFMEEEENIAWLETFIELQTPDIYPFINKLKYYLRIYTDSETNNLSDEEFAKLHSTGDGRYSVNMNINSGQYNSKMIQGSHYPQFGKEKTYSSIMNPRNNIPDSFRRNF